MRTSLFYNNQKTIMMKNIFLFMIAWSAFFNANAQELNGYWEAQGYGLFAEITENQLDLYTMTSISLIPVGSIPLIGNQVGIDEEMLGHLSIENDLLFLEYASTVFSGGIRFESVPTMPEVIEPTDDPVKNFEIFWKTFEEYGALFSILEVDWQAQYDLYSSQIDSLTTDQELFEIMGEMIGEFDDGHCYIINNNNQGIGSAQEPPTGLWYTYPDLLVDLLQTKYVDEGNIQYYADNSVVSATINEGTIGYLYISSFVISEENTYNDNMAFEEILNTVFTSFENTEGLIIDVRGNGGGYDSNSRVLGNHLTKETQTVFSKQVRLKDSYDSFSEPFNLEITPTGVLYVDKPVIVLTSDVSASATDGFAMLAKEIDCVTTMGETTEGIFSDILEMPLPNGWRFTLSTERYLDVGGINYEQQGIVPDVLVEEDENALLVEEVDNVLEFAIANIGNACDVVAIRDIDKVTQIEVYPNPFTHSINVDAIQDKSDATLTVYDISGKQVFEKMMKQHELQETSTIDLSALPVGMYNLVIKTQNQVLNSKLVKGANQD